MLSKLSSLGGGKLIHLPQWKQWQTVLPRSPKGRLIWMSDQVLFQAVEFYNHSPLWKTCILKAHRQHMSSCARTALVRSWSLFLRNIRILVSETVASPRPWSFSFAHCRFYKHFLSARETSAYFIGLSSWGKNLKFLSERLWLWVRTQQWQSMSSGKEGLASDWN